MNPQDLSLGSGSLKQQENQSSIGQLDEDTVKIAAGKRGGSLLHCKDPARSLVRCGVLAHFP